MVLGKEQVESGTVSAVRNRMKKNAVMGIIVHYQIDADNGKAMAIKKYLRFEQCIFKSVRKK